MTDKCIKCESENLDEIDSTYSNYDSARASKGQITGIIYQCRDCANIQIDDLLSNVTREYQY